MKNNDNEITIRINNKQVEFILKAISNKEVLYDLENTTSQEFKEGYTHKRGKN
jgi:hypothetical protein